MDTLWGDETVTDSTSYRIRLSGATLQVEETGSGDPLLLIHGSLDGMHSFDRQVPQFSRRYRVICYARRFHPPSEDSTQSEEYTLELHVGDLLALLDALGLESAHLVGSSYGAYVALGCALRAPGRTRSLVLAEPPILPFLRRTGEGQAELDRFYRTALQPAREAFARGERLAAVGYFVDGIRGMRGAFGALPESSREDLLRFGPELEMELRTESGDFMPDLPCPALHALKTPALLVTGERSPRLFGLIIDELERCLKHSKRLEVTGAGHAMHVMNPTGYTRGVLAFLQEAL